ncbi:type II secretion system F family protein [Rugosimonospora africana]|uniref:Type II secretion system protein GspF domain-containing protein n=1 Tax=Rugosimonospora africana TaxID=556532 RepID=A0A8J3QSL6_9ACTN|nr:type II secretion system F family protein [Rugosimonospora africana]GIH16099.1 hypothetical protein Raf01_42710 [Rugosimonospora africana]
MLGMLCGAVVGLGVLLVADGLRRAPRPVAAMGQGRVMQWVRSRGPVQVATAVAAAALVGLVTRWPVGALLAGLAVWTLPGMLLGAERVRQRRLERLDAIAAWTESLVATLAGAAGVEQTIIATARNPPAAIRPEVQALSVALRGGVPLPAALRGFAADLSDPVADTVVAALILAASEGTGRLTEPLNLLAEAAREEVAAARRVEKGRAKAASDARIVIITTLVMAVGLIVFNRGYLQPYSTTAGQVVLAVVGGLFAAGFRWLHRLSRPAELPRLLDLSADVALSSMPAAQIVRGGER